jgi:hypothetical protein
MSISSGDRGRGRQDAVAAVGREAQDSIRESVIDVVRTLPDGFYKVGKGWISARRWSVESDRGQKILLLGGKPVVAVALGPTGEGTRPGENRPPVSWQADFKVDPHSREFQALVADLPVLDATACDIAESKTAAIAGVEAMTRAADTTQLLPSDQGHSL